MPGGRRRRSLGVRGGGGAASHWSTQARMSSVVMGLLMASASGGAAEGSAGTRADRTGTRAAPAPVLSAWTTSRKSARLPSPPATTDRCTLHSSLRQFVYNAFHKERQRQDGNHAAGNEIWQRCADARQANAGLAGALGFQ